MTTKTRKPTRESSLLGAIHESQAKVVDLAQDMTRTIGESMPKVWNQPLAEGIPPAREIAESGFTLVRDIMASAHGMTEKVVGQVAESMRQQGREARK